MRKLILLFALAFGAHLGLNAQLIAIDNFGSMIYYDLDTDTDSLMCTGLGTEPCHTELERVPGSDSLLLQGCNGLNFIDKYTIDCNNWGATVPTADTPANDGYALNGLEYVGNTLYGVGIQGPCGPSTLFTVNPANGILTPIGPTNTGPVSGLAYDESNNTMYGVTGCAGGGKGQDDEPSRGIFPPGESILITIDLNTGQSSFVAGTGRVLGGLAFGPDGTLYASGAQFNSGELFTIDKNTGDPTQFGFMPSSDGPLTGLIYFDIMDDQQVAAPDAIPTLSQWGLFLFGLVFVTLGMVLVYQRQIQFSAQIAGGRQIKMRQMSLPFDKDLFKRCMTYAIGIGILGFGVIQIGWGEILPLDVVGVTVSIPIIAYLLLLFCIRRNNP